MPLNWTEIDSKFTGRGLSPLGNNIKQLFNKAIESDVLSEKLKNLNVQRDSITDRDARKPITREISATGTAAQEAKEAILQIPKILKQITLTPDSNSVSVINIIMSEIWATFPLNSRIDILASMMRDVELVKSTSNIDPITNTNIADIVLPTTINTPALFDFIVSKSQNPNVADNNGLTALSEAVKKNSPSMVKKLLEKGATVDSSLTAILFNNFYKTTTILTDFDLPAEGVIISLGSITLAGTMADKVSTRTGQQEIGNNGYSLNAENAIKILGMLTEKGLDINSFDANGMNAFFFASHSIFTNNNWMIDKIMAMPTFNVNAQNQFSLTPISWVCQNKKSDLVLKLASREDFNPTIAPQDGYLPYIALLSPQETMPLLEKLNLDINAQNSAGQTLFYWACKHQNIELAKEIASCPDFDVSIVTHQGHSPFIIAAEHLLGTEIFDILQSRLAPLTIKEHQGFDAFSTAIYWDKLEMAQWIHAHSKAPLNNPISDGKYPIHIATEKGLVEVLQWLVDNGYNVNQTSSNHEKFTALQLADKLTENKDEIINILKTAGAENEVEVNIANKQSETGKTPFAISCERDDHETAEDNDLDDLDVTIVDKDGNGPIHYATILSDLDGAKTIISGCLTKGADINARNFAGQTPLIHSIYVGRPDMAIALLDLDVDPMIPDNNGAYPIHIAAGKGHVTVLEKLFTKGLDLNYPASNYLKESPLKLAKQYEQDAVIEWLLTHGAKDVEIDEIPALIEAAALDPAVDLGGATPEVFEIAS